MWTTMLQANETCIQQVRKKVASILVCGIILSPYCLQNAFQLLGFGALSSGGSTTSRLKHVELAHVPNSQCNSPNAYGGEITQYMMCAADSGQDSCQGDSGEYN